MGMINDKALALIAELNRETWASVASQAAIPQTAKTFMYFHLNYPWLPGFQGVAISPLNRGLDNFLGRPLFDFNGMTFYYPSSDWWMAHSERSHPPGGAGCDAQVHIDFLTHDGSSPEFLYAIVMRNGDIKVADAADFENECSFWSASQE